MGGEKRQQSRSQSRNRVMLYNNDNWFLDGPSSERNERGNGRSNTNRGRNLSRGRQEQGEISDDPQRQRRRFSENSRLLFSNPTPSDHQLRSESSSRSRPDNVDTLFDRRPSGQSAPESAKIRSRGGKSRSKTQNKAQSRRPEQNWKRSPSTESLTIDVSSSESGRGRNNNRQQCNWRRRSPSTESVASDVSVTESRRGRNNHRGKANQNRDSFSNENRPRPKGNRKFGYIYLRGLLQKNTSEKILNLIDPHNGLEEFLSCTAKLPFNMVANLLVLISSIVSEDFHKENQFHLMSLLLSKDFFSNHIMGLIREIRAGKKTDFEVDEICLCLSKVMDAYLLRFPQVAADELRASAVFFISEFRKLQQTGELTDNRGIQNLTNFEMKANELFEKQLQEVKKKPEKKCINVMEEEPPDCFRNIPVIPSTLEITTRQKPFLRLNIVKGVNKDVEDYLDRQFRLLREDFVAPLREGITEYLHQINKNPNQRKFNDIRIYNKVMIHSRKEFHKANDGFTYIVEFDTKPFGRMKWEYSRRLIFGSLLCLSSDNFQTMILATVADRKIEELRKGILSVRFEGKEFEEITLNKDQEKKVYVMAESQAYFEAYRHILKALQSIKPETLPFQKYIIELQAIPSPPLYLEISQDEYDLSSIVKSSSDDSPLIDVLRLSTWPSAQSMGLDNSQLRAVQYALSSELSIIQGPPGTGKTYVGLKIISVLLRNKHLWNDKRTSPILVVCYTNHALDQFLEGILPYTRHLLRIGGRSKNVALESYNLNRIRNRIKSDHAREGFIHYNMARIKAGLSKLRFFLDDLDEKRGYMMQGIIHEESLRDIPAPYNNLVESLRGGFQANFMIAATELPFRLQSFVASWLGLTLDNLVPEDEIFEFYENDEGDFIPVGKQRNRAPAVDKEVEQMIAQEVQDEKEADGDLIDVEDEVKREEERRRLEVDSDDEDFDLDEYKGESEEKIAFALFLRDFEDPGDLVGQYGMGIPREMIEPMIEIRKQIFQREIEKFDTMDDEEISKIENVWFLPLSDRWRLYRKWMKLKFEQLNEKTKDLQERYVRECRRLKEVMNGEDLSLMQNSDVIGMTTTGAAKYHEVLQQVGPKIIIVEEAAEVLEAHITAALTANTQQLILIGDHKQLRPNPTVYRLAKDYNLEISMFERLIQNGIRHETLQLQHRMRPEISRLLVPNIYPDLRDHSSVLQHQNIKGIGSSVFFLNHSFAEEEIVDSKTKANKFEAEFIAKLCRHLLSQGYSPDQITILTTYAGQLFTCRELMRKGIFEGVQVTVVDNYQGEENDIILLSFVRSNEEGKIGFLSIENRVCVALSRAKKGLFCAGNFHLFAERSEVWRKIVADLERTSSIGEKMPLRCQRHPNIEMEVATSADFDRLSPEGGCYLPCDTELPCGHMCPRVCHAGNHLMQKCEQRCEKILCILGHQCPKKCSDECGRCTVTVLKKLPNCDHELRLPCWKDESTVQCKVIVTKTVPNCNHTVRLECYVDVSTYSCVEPVEKDLPCGHSRNIECHKDPITANCLVNCDYRLDCGHQCYRKCHVNDDPEHLNIDCKKPCAKKCERNHACKNFCYQPCEKCLIITDLEFPCGHTKKLPCSTDLSTVKCEKPCEKLLTCGHQCPLICYKFCDQKFCEQRVPRKLPCGHTVTARCGDHISAIPCSNQCDKLLICGHRCQNKCHQSCTEDCQEKVKVDGQCGHEMQVPCGRKNDLPELLQGYCRQPCGALLPCEHHCVGSCGECRRGRLHIACGANCGRVQICGHTCNVPCATDCPPCKRKCPTKCVHSRCPKNCGTPCKRCYEPCAWNCPHFKCNKKCWEYCERERCNEPCTKILRCGHPCIGLCGERCPKLCRICNKEKVEEILFGNEDEPNARFILLEDCNHCIEVEGLDQWMDTDGGEVKMKECPRCKTVIWRSQRYGNIIKKCFQDVRDIKKRHFGSYKHQYHQMRIVLRKLENTNLQSSFSAQYNIFRKSLTGRWALSNSELAAVENQMNILGRMEKLQDESKKMSQKAKNFVAMELKTLCKYLMDRSERINEYVVNQINEELNRLGLLAAFFQVEEERPLKSALPDLVRGRLERIKHLFEAGRTLSNEEENSIRENLRAIGKTGLGITDTERIQIVQAMGLSKGHWFKCPNGHIYCITECGGAMQRSVCNECGAAIGGANHALDSTNALASEMDGARYAAFSDLANIENFDPREFMNL